MNIMAYMYKYVHTSTLQEEAWQITMQTANISAHAAQATPFKILKIHQSQR